MKLLLQIKTPDSKEFETVSTAEYTPGNAVSLAAAAESLLRKRDGFQDANVFPPGSAWRTVFPRPA